MPPTSRLSQPLRILIVGGGASGLELATQLGDQLGRRGLADVTLIEKKRTHIWKPKLHEIAAGSMDLGNHEVDYMAQAHWHHFNYRIGEMIGLNRQAKEVLVAAYKDEYGEVVTPQSSLGYDYLVICIGSLSNDFGTPGVQEHALRLETQEDAKAFHSKMLHACIRAHTQKDALKPGQLHVAIIGAGATGVELSAELHRTTREVIAYGLSRVDPNKDLRLTLIEAAPRILPALPERLSSATYALLTKMGVQVFTNAKVSAVKPNTVQLTDGRELAAELVVWAAGVKAAEFLNNLDGLETNKINQLVVLQTLQTSRDPFIFAMGDCAACPWPQANNGQGGWVPPRAQAAHQQASHLLAQFKRLLRGQPIKPYCYKDFGSLVSLGKFSTIGSMMGGLIGNNLMIEGAFAKLMYLSLYKMHELALHGWIKVSLDTLARLITRRTEPHVKLH
jgi:NADH:ubiquinone reductase (H+-translocating)